MNKEGKFLKKLVLRRLGGRVSQGNWVDKTIILNYLLITEASALIKKHLFSQFYALNYS